MNDVCKDCSAEFGGFPPPARQKRPIVEKSGGRCATHWREERKRRKAAAHEKRVQRVYGLKDGEYDQLYELQGGVCAVCQRATGASRKLSVDHDHATGQVRGLLCRPCNSMLGHGRDSRNFFFRAIQYLTFPPYKQLNRDPNAVSFVWPTDEAHGDWQVP